MYHTANMALAACGVKMHNTCNMDRLASSLIDLIGLLNSPQRDDVLLRDRALFPLLVRLGARSPLGVAELAGQVGRDPTTVSRQLAKLERLGLIERCGRETDRRTNAARLTAGGHEIVDAITAARRRLLSQALADWSEADRAALADLNRRFADALIGFAAERS